MTTYPSIADHGLIGDLQTAALVSTGGSIDWFCTPRFDSPSVFGALLDADRGGHCTVRAAGRHTTQQLYLPDTAVLVTRFLSERGVGEVIDFMPISGDVASETHRIVRILACVRGQIDFTIDVAPRFDYGREPHVTHVFDGGVQFEGGRTLMRVYVVDQGTRPTAATVTTDSDGDVHARAVLRAGHARAIVVETGVPGVESTPIATVEKVHAMLDDTSAFWRSWVDRSTYRGRWREQVARSAITLKLMTYAPTGAVIAAPTAALPEQIGGERNWDYRYTWVRDASFSVYSLLGLGYTAEAIGLGRWLSDRIDEQAGDGASGPLNIMYRIDGSTDLKEQTLEHWEGYRRSSPVRVGNEASQQLQLDIYGEAMDSVFVADQSGVPIGHQSWQRIVTLLDWVADNWDQPEEGIWETRGGRLDFTYGRLMNWVALDRGIRMATAHGRPAPIDRWRTARDAIYTQIMDRGWSTQRRAFRQHYDSDVLDASLLRMPTLGFVMPTDPLWLSTLDAMERDLVTDSLVYRYDPEASPDGLRGTEGTFSLCSFAYVNALARAGRLGQARVAFEKMLTYANHLGLYSEEIALSGEQIGNFPQAFTHLSLIDAALVLNKALDVAPSGRGGQPTATEFDAVTAAMAASV
jgi:GH15 family glucan-1,4-alpha-glucosidase